MKTILSLFSILAAMLLAGCVSDEFTEVKTSDLVVKESETTAVAFKKALAGRLHTMEGGALRPAPELMLVSSLVDVSHLRQSSGFGRIFSEQLSGDLARLGFNVTDVKLVEGFRVASGDTKWQEGEFALSRDIQEITRQQKATAIVVGTYAKGRDDVLVAVRVLDAKTGQIIASRNFQLPYDAVLFR